MTRPHSPGHLPRRRFVGALVAALGVLAALLATSCMNFAKVAPGDELGCAIERDGVLPEGAVWRSSMTSRSVCIFGVTDRAAQDRVVEGARESLQSIGGPKGWKYLTVEFWSGEPPPRSVQIRSKPVARPRGEPPQSEAEFNAPYAIRRLRTVEIR